MRIELKKIDIVETFYDYILELFPDKKVLEAYNINKNMSITNACPNRKQLLNWGLKFYLPSCIVILIPFSEREFSFIGAESALKTLSLKKPGCPG